MKTIWNKTWSLKSLDMLKCEGRTSLHAVQYKRQPGSVLITLRMASRRGYSVSKRLVKPTRSQDFPSQLPGYLPPLSIVLSHRL